MADHTPTPWHYRPYKYDDWGWIRATPGPGEPVGATVAMARSGTYQDEDAFNEHRRNKTDPYEANAKFIVKAANSHDALVKALQHSTDLMEELIAGYIPGSAPNLRDDKRREEQIAENRALLAEPDHG